MPWRSEYEAQVVSGLACVEEKRKISIASGITLLTECSAGNGGTYKWVGGTAYALWA